MVRIEVICAVSLALGAMGATGVTWVARLGGAGGLMDTPNGRSLHSVPTPKGGGVGILCAFLLASFCLSLHWTFWLPATVAALAGLLGDIADLSVRLRLFLQFVAAAVFICGVTYWENSHIAFANILFWTVFMAGTANFYNFMDGINGIAGITAVVAFGLMALFAVIEGRDGAVVPLCLSVICAAMGFLPLNIPKARVFMGDVGSVFLGFLFAGLVFLLSESMTDFLVLVSFLFPFYADELVTMAIRLRAGESLFKAHRRHLYQLLSHEFGYPHWVVAFGFGMLQLLVGGSALYLGQKSGLPVVCGLLLGAFLAFAGLSFGCRRRMLRIRA